MKDKKYINFLTVSSISICSLLLSGCNNVLLMNPKGQIGLEQRSLILMAIGLMLIIVIPAIIMAMIFPIKYRKSNSNAKYDPNWKHSNKVEFVVWSIPIIIIICLAFLTWNSTKNLDPNKPITSHNVPITIEVVALDWKWLFIYPELGIGAINEIAIPINTPIIFKITSHSVMNSFFIPQLGSQIYAMAGMQTTLNLIANEPGEYKGISSNFSGKGFSGMKFTVIATQDNIKFNEWVEKIKHSTNKIKNFSSYEYLARPSENDKTQYFSFIFPELFKKVLNQFVKNKNIDFNSLKNCHNNT